MRHPLLVPKLGLTMAEGALVEWMVAPGQAFKAGQGLFVIESEKAANEIAAEADGVLLEATGPLGASLAVGTVIGWWDDGHAEDRRPAMADASARGAETPARAAPAPLATASAAVLPAAPPVALPAAESPRVPVTPLARRLARQRGLALERVRGSGPNGRIRARDLPALRPGRLLVLAAAELSRRRALAVQVAPQFLLAREAEISTLLACRERLNAARPTPRYTLNHFVVAALGRALMELPELNRVWTDDGPLMLERSDVGLAAATAQGSAAPLLREAGHLSLPQIAQACVDIEERARSGRLGADACIGGAVTVHHAGLYRLNALAAPLQSGQSMSLATGSVCDGFGADAAGRPVLRRELTLTLAADARVFEADAAAALLRRTVQHLEQVQELLQPPPARAPS